MCKGDLKSSLFLLIRGSITEWIILSQYFENSTVYNNNCFYQRYANFVVTETDMRLKFVEMLWIMFPLLWTINVWKFLLLLEAGSKS